MQKSKKGKKVLLIILGSLLGLILAAAIFLFFSAGTGNWFSRYQEKLEALPNVVKVEKVTGQVPFSSAERYLVYFEQPIDHENPSLGSFTQRVYVAVSGSEHTNVIETNGYLFADLDAVISGYGDHELCGIVGDGNYINVEHRFFDFSSPEGLDNDSTELWEYLTTKNAAADVHEIIKSLSNILSKEWIVTGSSKGGLTCNMFTYYYPDDVALNVPYVAPFGEGLTDTRMYDWVYGDIGNVKYGEEQARKYQDLITAFQVECIRFESELAPMLRDVAKSRGLSYREFVTDEILFELAVNEFALMTWQYNQNFDIIQTTLDMPDNDDASHKAKLEAMINCINSCVDIYDWAVNAPVFSYYVQAAKENGQYLYDFSHIREALEADGNGLTLTITEDMEDYFLPNVMFTKEQQEAFTYDPTIHNALKDWVNTTDSKVIMIYGASDPWYGLRIPDTDNPNVHIFVNKDQPHSAQISGFPEEEQKEIKGLIMDSLGR